MDVLKNLTASDLDELRHAFTRRRGEDGLTEPEFVDVVSRVCERRGVHIGSPKTLRDLFAKVDVLGEERVSWDGFSMYAIEQSLREDLQRGKPTAGAAPQDVVFRPFRLEQLVPNTNGCQVMEIRMLPRTGKVMKVTLDNAGQTSMVLCDAVRNLPLFGILRQDGATVLAWDYIPSTADVPCANSVVCSYNGSFMRTFSLDKSYHFERYLEGGKQIRLPESQTAVHWLVASNRLALGNRNGYVSIWDMHTETFVFRKRVHQKTITAMHGVGPLLYTASMDETDSVKGIDLENGAVRIAFDDHKVGGAMVLEMDEHFLFSVGFERRIVQRPISSLKSALIVLSDQVTPHRGRITSLHRVSGTPFLVSGDTRGMIKFWDLRTSSCTQTLQGRSFLLSDRDEEMLEEGEFVSHYMNAHVNSICHLETLSKLTVTTSRELLVLSAEESIRPDLVDDHHSCRFVFFPNPENLLTVHDRGAKLWDSMTGMLTCNEPKLVHADITACCLVVPLNRQILLGTMEGEVTAFSVSLLHRTIDLTSALREFVQRAEITALHLIQKYRDMPSPYVLVATQNTLSLAPLIPDCIARSVVHLHAMLSVFMPNQAIRVTAVTQNHLLIATSDAYIRVVEFQRSFSVTHTLAMPNEVEAILVRPISSFVFGPDAPKGVLNNYIAFIADVTGRLHIAALRPSSFGSNNHTTSIVQAEPSNGTRVSEETVPSPTWTATSLSTFPFLSTQRPRAIPPPRPTLELLGSWLPSRSASWSAPGGRRPTLRKPSGRASYEHRRSAAMAAGLPAPLDAAAPSGGVLLALLEPHAVLATADEEGLVQLWDVSRAMAQGAAMAPLRILAWRMPERAVLFLGAAEHPTRRLPVLLAATGDRRASLWSTDGARLGTLATGREADAASGGRRFGLLPYALHADAAGEALWDVFASHLRRRRVGSPLPRVSAPWRRSNTSRPRALLPQLVEGSPGALPPLPAFAMDSSPREGDAQREPEEGVEGDMGAEEEEEAEETERRRRWSREKRTIVKNAHKELVTRSPVPFSLRRTGVVRLPALKGKVAQQRR